jgi:hypothetical protein
VGIVGLIDDFQAFDRKLHGRYVFAYS